MSNSPPIVLPSNREAELGVVGAMMDGGIESALIAATEVPSKAFFHDDIRTAFDCLKRLIRTGRQPEPLNLVEEWRALKGNDSWPTPEILSALDRHAKYVLPDRIATVLEVFERRQAVQAGNVLMRGGADESRPIKETLAEAEKILNSDESIRIPTLDGKQLAGELTNDLDRRAQLNGALSGMSTGFPRLDGLTDGLQPGEFWVIAARPSKGKTALAVNVAQATALHSRIPTLFVSLEMSAVAITRRMMSAAASVGMRAIRSGQFTEQEFKAMTVFNGKLSSSPFYVLDAPGGLNIGRLCAMIRSAIRRWKVRVVMLDYIQKIRPDMKGEKKTYEIGDCTSQLVALTKREGINLFALAQLNRENEKDKGRKPRLADLADSKQIEADADLVGLLHRGVGDEESQAELIIAKQRDGETGMVPLHFEGKFCRFEPERFEAPSSGKEAASNG